METIGERIKDLRKSVDLNQKEFAKKISISQGSLSDIEKGRNKPSIETLLAISNIFRVSLDWLIKGELKENLYISTTKNMIQQIAKNIKKSFNEEEQIILIESLNQKEIQEEVYDQGVEYQYRTGLTKDELNLLKSFYELPIKDQEDIKLFIEIKNNPSKKVK